MIGNMDDGTWSMEGKANPGSSWKDLVLAWCQGPGKLGNGFLAWHTGFPLDGCSLGIDGVRTLSILPAQVRAPSSEAD